MTFLHLLQSSLLFIYIVVRHALVRPLLDFVHDWMKNAITQNNAHLERDDDSS